MSKRLLKLRSNLQRPVGFTLTFLGVLVFLVHIELYTTARDLDDGEIREAGKVRHLHDIKSTFPSSQLFEDSVDTINRLNSGNRSPGGESTFGNHKPNKFKDILKLIHNRKPKITTDAQGRCIIEDDIFWSREVENVIPKDNYDDIVERESAIMRNSVVGAMTDQKMRGKSLNSMLTMQGGVKILAKYRTKCLSIAEASSFYLSRLLGMNNVPTIGLTKPNPSSPQWNNQAVRMKLQDKGWKSDDYVTLNIWLTDFIENVSFPKCILHNDKQIWVGNVALQDMTLQSLSDLAQWSDMVILDYLIFHTDRVTRSLRTISSAIKEPWLLDLTIKNLGRRGRKFWLIDNEATASFVSRIKPTTIDLNYHEYLLNSTCVFRRQTVENIVWLYYQGGLDTLLSQTVTDNEPLITDEDITECKSNSLFHRPLAILEQRLQRVYQHILRCVSYVDNSKYFERINEDV